MGFIKSYNSMKK